LLKVFVQGDSRYAASYLDKPGRRILGLPHEPSRGANGPRWEVEMQKAQRERLLQRLQSQPETLAWIPRYDADREAEEDWSAFLQRYPSQRYRDTLDRAYREFNGGPRDLWNVLATDYPGECDAWLAYREKRIGERLQRWLNSVGVSI
jgi:hypothetical protein